MIEEKLKILEIVKDLTSQQVDDLIKNTEKLWKYIHNVDFIEKDCKDKLKKCFLIKNNPDSLSFEQTLKDPVYMFIANQIINLGTLLEKYFNVANTMEFTLLNFKKEKLPDYFHEDAKIKIMEGIEKLQKIYDDKCKIYRNTLYIESVKGLYFEDNQKQTQNN